MPETTANFNFSREWQTPATQKLPILSLRKSATTSVLNWNAEDVVVSAFHVLYSRAFSVSISNVNLSFSLYASFSIGFWNGLVDHNLISSYHICDNINVILICDIPVLLQNIQCDIPYTSYGKL